MNWKRLLAHISGSVDQELLVRNEYLATENRILRNQIQGRLQLNDSDLTTLVEIGKRLGRKALEEAAQMVRPETILAWHRRLVAKKFDGSKNRLFPGRPTTDDAIEELVLKFARENRSWGYHRIVGALSNVGYEVSHQTVANILERHGLLPAPDRERKTSWREFIRSHTEVLATGDFLTAPRQKQIHRAYGDLSASDAESFKYYEEFRAHFIAALSPETWSKFINARVALGTAINYNTLPAGPDGRRDFSPLLAAVEKTTGRKEAP